MTSFILRLFLYFHNRSNCLYKQVQHTYCRSAAVHSLATSVGSLHQLRRYNTASKASKPLQACNLASPSQSPSTTCLHPRASKRMQSKAQAYFMLGRLLYYGSFEHVHCYANVEVVVCGLSACACGQRNDT